MSKTDQADFSDEAVTGDNRVSIFPILLVNFIGTLTYSIILPFLIVLVIKLGGNELNLKNLILLKLNN